MAKHDEERGYRTLLCDLKDAFPAADQFDILEMKFEPVDPSSTERPRLGVVLVPVQNGVFTSSIPIGPFQAVAVLQDAVELRIRWNETDAGEVAECTEVKITRQLVGIYLTPAGVPLVGGKLAGCGRDMPLADNEPIWIAIPPDPCKVAITVRHGGRSATGPYVEILPTAGSDVDVEVPWPVSSDLRKYLPIAMQMMRWQLRKYEGSCGPELDQCNSLLQGEAVAIRDELAAAEAAWIEDEGAVPEVDPSAHK
jgi:hypothetical protein